MDKMRVKVFANVNDWIQPFFFCCDVNLFKNSGYLFGYETIQTHTQSNEGIETFRFPFSSSLFSCVYIYSTSYDSLFEKKNNNTKDPVTFSRLLPSMANKKGVTKTETKPHTNIFFHIWLDSCVLSVCAFYICIHIFCAKFVCEVSVKDAQLTSPCHTW